MVVFRKLNVILGFEAVLKKWPPYSINQKYYGVGEIQEKVKIPNFSYICIYEIRIIILQAAEQV